MTIWEANKMLWVARSKWALLLTVWGFVLGHLAVTHYQMLRHIGQLLNTTLTK